MHHKSTIQDQYGREFKTLRVSLTSICNMSCVYCVAPGTIHQPSLKKPIQMDAYINIIARLHHQLQLKTIRLTGGEPLLFKELPGLIKGITDLGIRDIKLTTNGLKLVSMLDELHQAGLRSINISIDALDPTVFKNITRVHEIRSVLDAIDAATAMGMEVKLNTVVLKGINDHQIIPLLEYASARNIPIRFLELMKMGYLQYQNSDYFFGLDEIVEKIASVTSIAKMERAASNTASYWQTSKGAVFGVIANESDPFCSDCNRLRLDSYGNIFGCISSSEGIDIRDITNQELTEALQIALLQKQDRFTGSELSMKYIGG